jgi:hypothetical protein
VAEAAGFELEEDGEKAVETGHGDRLNAEKRRKSFDTSRIKTISMEAQIAKLEFQNWSKPHRART